MKDLTLAFTIIIKGCIANKMTPEQMASQLNEHVQHEVKNLNIPAVSSSSSPDDFWKQEYDEAVKEIGNLQDQLKDAESAIRDMESELRSRY